MANTMTRQEIMSRLEDLPFLDIFEVTEEYAVVYDQHNETDFTVRFAEHFTKQHLKELIHVCPDIPSCLRFDVDMLTDYLWSVMDHNAFLTLAGLWYVYNEEDYQKLARFHSCHDGALLPEHKAKGCMWFARQVCIVDVQQIERFLIRKNPQHWNDPNFDSIGYLRRELIVTTLHELRHLMLDTNPTLPIEDYPLELGSEFLVERYAQDICEDAQILHIFTERNDDYDCN